MDTWTHIGPLAFASGPGTQTITLPAPLVDLSGRRQLLAVLKVTAADTDAGDTLDGVVQFSYDGVIWNSWAAWGQIIGTASPTSTAPEIRNVTIQQGTVDEVTEEANEPTGSAGATPLAAGSVRHQSLPGKAYVAGIWVPTLRAVLSIVDADSDGGFSGTVDFYIS